MPYKMNIIPDTQIGYFCWVGPITVEMRRNNRAKIVAFCEKEAIQHVIIDGRYQESYSRTLEDYDFGKETPEVMRGLKVAVVSVPGDTSLRFIDTVASTRGAFIRSFDTIRKAREWLIPPGYSTLSHSEPVPVRSSSVSGSHPADT